MKNNKTILSSILILVLCLIFVSGCDIGGEKITCTTSDEENGIKENIEVVAVSSNDTISKVSATLSYNSETDMNTMCDILKNMPSSDLNFSCSGSSIKIKNFDKMLEFNAIDSSKESFIGNMEQNGYTCS